MLPYVRRAKERPVALHRIAFWRFARYGSRYPGFVMYSQIPHCSHSGSPGRSPLAQSALEALRSLGRETQLVIYPNQFHGIKRPSYIRDRYERYLAWYDKHLKPPPPAKKANGTAKPVINSR